MGTECVCVYVCGDAMAGLETSIYLYDSLYGVHWGGVLKGLATESCCGNTGKWFVFISSFSSLDDHSEDTHPFIECIYCSSLPKDTLDVWGLNCRPFGRQTIALPLSPLFNLLMNMSFILKFCIQLELVLIFFNFFKLKKSKCEGCTMIQSLCPLKYK